MRRRGSYNSFNKNGPMLCRCPDNFITSYSSYELTNPTQWVCCRFSCNSNDENVIALGDEEGYVTIANVRQTANFDDFVSTGSTFKADSSVIMDCHFLPGASNRLITIAGSKEVRIWDLQTQNYIGCIGHELSVRTISVCPDNPNLFLTGARDGVVLAWDVREPLQKLKQSRHSDRTVVVECRPHRKYMAAHVLPTASLVREPKRPRLSSTIRYSSRAPIGAPMAAKKIATITAVEFADDKFFLSASSTSQSGIRLWDMRYQQCSKPMRTFNVPKHKSKDCGMTSLCWDRFRSHFYATCTDDNIYEYTLDGRSNAPIRTLVGAKIGSFYVRCATSPLTDHLACGTSDGQALIWDLQETRRFPPADVFGRVVPLPSTSTSYLPFPKYTLGGHQTEISAISWSVRGRYMLTLDDSWLRIWDSTNDWFHRRSKEKPPMEWLINDVPHKVERPVLLPAPTRELIATQLERLAPLSQDSPLTDPSDSGYHSSAVLSDIENIGAMMSQQCQRHRSAGTIQCVLPASFFAASSPKPTTTVARLLVSPRPLSAGRKRKVKEELRTP